MEEKSRSLYIHIPFCKKICSYCDFAKLYYNEDLVDKYLSALEKEITEIYQNDLIKTIYIGGGTPSALKISQLARLFLIIEKINLKDSYEMTFEFNVEDITEEKLKFLKEKGVNRLSIGIETVGEKFFKFLNRENELETCKAKVELSKLYFDNISLDLIYGFYNQSIEELDKDLDFLLSLKVPHLSIYSLIIEKNTLLYINKVPSIDVELEAEMYYHIIYKLASFGYEHYEISNFAQRGFKSKHNLTYWNNEEYYGFGLGAHYYLDSSRGENTRSLNKYLEGNYLLSEEKLNLRKKMENHLILGLRKIKGVNQDEFFKLYDKKLEELFPITDLISKELLVKKNQNIFIPLDKLYVQNYILEHFIGENDE